MDVAFQKLNASYAELTKDPNNAKIKAQLRAAAQELIASTLSPQEAGTHFIWNNAIHPVYKAAADSGILSAWPKDVMSSEDIAKMTNVEERLVARLLRVLVGAGAFVEVGEAQYSHNKLSMALSNPMAQGMARYTWPGTSRLADYLKETSYRNPGHSTEVATPFQFANNTPLTFYQALARNEPARKAFDAQMKAHAANERATYQTGCASIYPFEKEISPLIESDSDVAIVDIGGSLGHVLEDVKKHISTLKGRLVLEELPETLQSVTVPAGVEAVPYNFLESEQPIKGAAVYLFRQIFLNWSDIRGHQILANTLPAMKRGHSRLLIMEPVIPEVKPPLPLCLMDIQMAQMGGGIRTPKQWTAFLDEAGFEVKRFLPSNSDQTIIEAVPK